jgi:hypothetical protein
MRSIQRFIDALALISVGEVLGVGGHKLDPIDFLIRAPKFRIDSVEQNNVGS